MDKIDYTDKDSWPECVKSLPLHKFDPNKKYSLEKHLYWGNQPIASAGNLIGVTGREGSRKSLFARCAAAAALGATDIDSTLNFNWNPWRERMRYFEMDTEQSQDDHIVLHRKFLKMCNLPLENDLTAAFELQAYEYNELYTQLSFYLELHSRHQDPFSIVLIDQLADLVPDENDREYAKHIVTQLLSFAKRYNLIIFVIMHTNRGGIEANGSLGSVLQKKAQAMFRIDYDSDTKYSTVHHVKTRVGRPIENFQFWHNERGMPEIITNG